MDNSKASNLGYIFKAKQGQKGVFFLIAMQQTKYLTIIGKK